MANANSWYRDPNQTQDGGTRFFGNTTPVMKQTAPPEQGVTQPYVAPTPQSMSTPGLAATDWANMTNLARRQNAAGWNSGAEALKRDLGGAGFRVGQSGIADSALGQFYQNKAEGIGQTTAAMAAEEAKNRFAQNYAMDQMEFDKSRWGQEFGASREDQAMQDMINYMNMMQGNQVAPYAAYWNAVSGANS